MKLEEFRREVNTVLESVNTSRIGEKSKCKLKLLIDVDVENTLTKIKIAILFSDFGLQLVFWDTELVSRQNIEDIDLQSIYSDIIRNLVMSKTSSTSYISVKKDEMVRINYSVADLFAGAYIKNYL